MTAPFVRAVVLNWNGGTHVLEAVACLLRTDWPADRLSVVVVDNASSDGSDREIERCFPQVEVRRNPRNLGFPGNNTAMTDLDGVDHVALVNNDAFVEPGWLVPLVEVLEGSPEVGAVAPKLLFAPRFSPVELSAPTFEPGGADPRLLSLRCSGVEVDGVDQWRHTWFGPGCFPGEFGPGNEAFRWLGGRAELGIPLPPGREPPVRARLRLAAPSVVDARLDVPRPSCAPDPITLRVGPEPAWFELDVRGAPFDVIQNAGSVLLEGGYGADRGFLQPDRGQFDEPVEVWAWCGGTTLLRADYLRQVGCFWSPFFMYYEDTDLAWRGRAAGWHYRYEPRAVVRHLHGTSAGEGSRLFQHYVERNRLVVLARNAPRGLLWSALGRYLLTMLSLSRNEVMVAARAHRPPRLALTRQRLSSLADFAVLLPRVVGERRRLRRRQVVPDDELIAWAQPRSSHPL